MGGADGDEMFACGTTTCMLLTVSLSPQPQL